MTTADGAMAHMQCFTPTCRILAYSTSAYSLSASTLLVQGTYATVNLYRRRLVPKDSNCTIGPSNICPYVFLTAFVTDGRISIYAGSMDTLRGENRGVGRVYERHSDILEDFTVGNHQQPKIWKGIGQQSTVFPFSSCFFFERITLLVS